MASTERAWIDQVIALERQLLAPAVRRDPRAVAELLHADFREVGASGRVWDRASIVASLASEKADSSIRDEEMEGVVLADGVVLLTYLTDERGRRARRSSVWRHDREAGWQLFFHQGTSTG